MCRCAGQADLLSLALLSYSVQQAFSDCTDLLPIAELQYYCQVCMFVHCICIVWISQVLLPLELCLAISEL